MWLKRVCCWTLIALIGSVALADEDYIPSAALRDVGLIKAWQLRLRLDEGQRLADIYLVDDQLYLATDDGYAFAVHADTGTNRWLRQITREGYRVLRPCHAGSQAIFATPAFLLHVDRLSGEGVDRYEFRFPAGTAPVSDGVRVYVGGLDQRIYAFDVATHLHGWKAITDGPITSTPALFEGNLFAASSDGTVHSCTAENKTYRWQRKTYGSVTSDLAVSGDGVYVPARDQSLYLLDLLFGQIRWQARFSGPLYEPPVLTADTAYQFCEDDGLVAVNIDPLEVERRIRWKLPRGRSLLTIADGQALVLSRDETILVVTPADGTVKHTLPAAGMTLAAPCPDRTALLLASPDGRVFCARPIGTPQVSRDDVRDALQPAGEAGEEEAAGAAEAAPIIEKEQPDRLKTSREGLPLGGKSKVSKEYGRGGGSGD